MAELNPVANMTKAEVLAHAEALTEQLKAKHEQMRSDLSEKIKAEQKEHKTFLAKLRRVAEVAPETRPE